MRVPTSLALVLPPVRGLDRYQPCAMMLHRLQQRLRDWLERARTWSLLPTLMAVVLRLRASRVSPRPRDVSRESQVELSGLLAYMAAIVPAVGVTASHAIHDTPVENTIMMSLGCWCILYLVSCALLPKGEREAWAVKYPTHSSASFADESTHAGYKHVPISYPICEEDESVSANAQREMTQMVEKESRNKVNVTSIQAGARSGVQGFAESD